MVSCSSFCSFPRFCMDDANSMEYLTYTTFRNSHKSVPWRVSTSTTSTKELLTLLTSYGKIVIGLENAKTNLQLSNLQ